MKISDISKENLNHTIHQIKYIKNQIKHIRYKQIADKTKNAVLICLNTLGASKKSSKQNNTSVSPINFVFNQEIMGAIKQEIDKNYEYKHKIITLKYELKKISKTDSLLLKIVFMFA
ncbi:MAG: hypothetical protein RLZZ210_1073 [Pseudomonadota bacterium]|jgi:hypothetical protein